VRQEARAAEKDLPGHFAKQAPGLHDPGPCDARVQATFGDSCGMHEGTSASSGDMHRVTEVQPLVVVNVSAQHESLSRARVEPQALHHLRTGGTRLAEGVDGIGKHREYSRGAPRLMVVANEFALP